MPIFNIFVINRAGSLIYDYDNRATANQEVELQFPNFPVDFKFDLIDNRATVIFGERDNIKVGFVVLACNGDAVQNGGKLEKSGENLFDIIMDHSKFPLTLKFVRPPLNTNEKIILSSMFHSLHAIGAQLSPCMKSSGIEVLDTDLFRLQCFQTITGMKFVLVADATTPNLDQFLRKLYELYADYAAKNPFYSLEMPIRCDLFDTNLKLALEKFEKSGVVFV